jgi:small subunit ribosomal protein S17
MIEEPEQTPPADAAGESAEDSAQAPAADAAGESTEDSAQSTEAEAPAAEPATAEAAPEQAPAADEAPAAEAEPEEAVHPKDRRKRARSKHTGETRPQRGPDERAAERAVKRSQLSASRRAYRQKQRENRAARPRPEVPQQEAAEHGPGRARVRQGVVVSAKPDKTITVRIDTARRHRTYKKIVRSSSTLHAHDERNEAHEGDTVRVVETRPISRTKRWRLIEILERAR